jgi:hypothetical protein
MATSSHHYDTPWCVVGPVTILYHTSISMNTSVSYDERSVFGSHGAYAVWTGTAPRSVSLSANMVAANSNEVMFNIDQVNNAYQWTQENPPSCEALKVKSGMMYRAIFDMSVRIESFDSSIAEATHLDGANPIQIDLSLGLKECKPI